jgi:hypothetical protein
MPLDARLQLLTEAQAEEARTAKKHRNDAVGQYSGNISRATKASIVGAFYSAPATDFR